eukprot:1362070-Amorphochlora_amoeboformis.AAC.1
MTFGDFNFLTPFQTVTQICHGSKTGFDGRPFGGLQDGLPGPSLGHRTEKGSEGDSRGYIHPSNTTPIGKTKDTRYISLRKVREWKQKSGI